MGNTLVWSHRGLQFDSLSFLNPHPLLLSWVWMKVPPPTQAACPDASHPPASSTAPQFPVVGPLSPALPAPTGDWRPASLRLGPPLALWNSLSSRIPKPLPCFPLSLGESLSLAPGLRCSSRVCATSLATSPPAAPQVKHQRTPGCPHLCASAHMTFVTRLGTPSQVSLLAEAFPDSPVVSSLFWLPLPRARALYSLSGLPALSG